VEVRPVVIDRQHPNNRQFALQILDFRREPIPEMTTEPIVWVRECPKDWGELQAYYRQAIYTQSKLALAYQTAGTTTDRVMLENLVGIAKYLAQTGESVNLQKLKTKLNIGDRPLKLGLDALVEMGFSLSFDSRTETISLQSDPAGELRTLYSIPAVGVFLAASAEEQFQRNYFLQVPVYALESVLGATLAGKTTPATGRDPEPPPDRPIPTSNKQQQPPKEVLNF
jgi:single-stranded-DNA-specific exonuclease